MFAALVRSIVSALHFISSFLLMSTKAALSEVSRRISEDMSREALEVWCAPGKTIARLHGELSSTKFPQRVLVSTKPFTLLSDQWF